MHSSEKSDIKDICKLIMRNSSGEIIFIQDLQTGQKNTDNGSSKYQDSYTAQTEDLFYQQMLDWLKSNNRYLILKDSYGESRTFARVSDNEL